MALTLKVQLSSAVSKSLETFELTIEPDATVAVLKEQIASKTTLTADALLVVGAGQRLTDGERDVGSYGVKAGSCLHCAKSLLWKPKPVNFKEKYAQQLEDLKSMGYEDERPSLVALIRHHGDVDKALEQLGVPSTPGAALRERYAQQLDDLKCMGFDDEGTCLAALVRHHGDLDKVVDQFQEEPAAEAKPAQPAQLAQAAPAAQPSQTAPAAAAVCEYEEGEVVAHVYDISGGMAHSSSQMIIGRYMELLPHTGIVVFGKEFFYSKAPATSEPGKSLPSPVRKVIKLGRTTKTAAEMEAFLASFNSEFCQTPYQFITHNSNHYADAVAKFLLAGEGLPSELISLMDELNSTPQGRQMATMLSSMESSSGGAMFTPTGTMFHGGTPAAPGMADMFAGLGQQGGSAGSEARFQTQLAQLNDMGFTNKERNIAALTSTDGNLDSAISIIVAGS